MSTRLRAVRRFLTQRWAWQDRHPILYGASLILVVVAAGEVTELVLGDGFMLAPIVGPAIGIAIGTALRHRRRIR